LGYFEDYSISEMTQMLFKKLKAEILSNPRYQISFACLLSAIVYLIFIITKKKEEVCCELAIADPNIVSHIINHDNKRAPAVYDPVKPECQSPVKAQNSKNILH
jgi:hypothetical protein